MAGIIGFGSYVPRYRLPRDVIGKEWGQPSMGGVGLAVTPGEPYRSRTSPTPASRRR